MMTTSHEEAYRLPLTDRAFRCLPRRKNGQIIDLLAFYDAITDEQRLDLVAADWNLIQEYDEQRAMTFTWTLSDLGIGDHIVHPHFYDEGDE